MNFIYRTRMATAAIQDHEAKFGRWGSELPNMHEISAEEFSQHSYWLYPFESVEYRDIHEGEFAGISLNIFHMHGDEGVAMARDHCGKRVRYFTFAACEHEWWQPATEDLKRGMPGPYHVSVCAKCGYVRSVDSSDVFGLNSMGGEAYA